MALDGHQGSEGDMPTTRRRSVRGRTGCFFDWQKAHLFTGHDFIGDGYGGWGDDKDFDEEAARADWERYRSGLLAEWFAAFGQPAGEREYDFDKPGCDSLRPWAWWQFDSPATRPEKTAESEFQFLARHGLLVEGDEARCDLLARQQEVRREQEERYIRQQEKGPYGKGGIIDA